VSAIQFVESGELELHEGGLDPDYSRAGSATNSSSDLLTFTHDLLDDELLTLLASSSAGLI
jgi:hypothetical protein